MMSGRFAAFHFARARSSARRIDPLNGLPLAPLASAHPADEADAGSARSLSAAPLGRSEFISKYDTCKPPGKMSKK